MEDYPDPDYTETEEENDSMQLDVIGETGARVGELIKGARTSVVYGKLLHFAPCEKLLHVFNLKQKHWPIWNVVI